MARGAAASREVAAHVESCLACARFLDDQIALMAAMQSVAAESGMPGAALEARVMAEFPAPRVPVWRWTVAAGVAAAACLAAISMLHHTPAPPIAQEQPFITIPYTVPLAPEEPAAVWHTRIPVSALIAVGFELQAMDPSTMVEADVLVSQDGRARAIRPVSISITN